jgi:hypothetical protein
MAGFVVQAMDDAAGEMPDVRTIGTDPRQTIVLLPEQLQSIRSTCPSSQ